jgi:hypothetical protein
MSFACPRVVGFKESIEQGGQLGESHVSGVCLKRQPRYQTRMELKVRKQTDMI